MWTQALIKTAEDDVQCLHSPRWSAHLGFWWWKVLLLDLEETLLLEKFDSHPKPFSEWISALNFTFVHKWSAWVPKNVCKQALDCGLCDVDPRLQFHQPTVFRRGLVVGNCSLQTFKEVPQHSEVERQVHFVLCALQGAQRGYPNVPRRDFGDFRGW